VITLRGERGEGRIGLLVALILLAVGIFLGVKIIPVRINAYEFGDFIQQECRFAAVRNQDAEVAKRILDKAIELEIPIKKKDLTLQRTANEMIITASYEQPIDLKVTVYNYRFYQKEKAPLF
jgi:hypothetical protein